ncbi:hypothetical protein BO221_50715 [Archangium sp. Cb G35]|uniref:FAD-dependent oxidoreductase n=1 Tax=Archangium sp. Cb G35 TaxID=1920190 RepID=UPI00093801AC|nr:FAD-dependent oxidoreductase [Archangium sp. Cb G35]OJT16319.1 hypothetical protein BO221_50715 [Archangium sp. Cb G35]
MRTNQPIKVAIIGGGCASMATAFELTRPELGSQYEVTVYQLGWRLGGKGASGRGAADRIEEHGLHLWMGFYENAFRMIRDCYSELRRDPRTCRIATWRDAFSPVPLLALTNRTRLGEWEYWAARFPPTRDLPGDPLAGENPFSLRGYFSRATNLLLELVRSARFPSESAGPWPVGYTAPPWQPPPQSGSVWEGISRLLKYGQLISATATFEGVWLLHTAVSTLYPHVHLRGRPQELLLQLLDGLGAAAHRQLEALTERDDELRRVWEVVDLILTLIRGSVRFGLATDPRGFDAIDDYDWVEWLRLNGLSSTAMSSSFLRSLYGLMFAYEDGDPHRPRLSASVMLRGLLRMFFTYRGALFWKMNSGMGDTIFAPMYEVLKRRGVRFRFFHRLRNLRLAPPSPQERPYVEALEFDLQAEVKGDVEYWPLVDVRGLPCWPSTPDYSQLIDGECMAREGWNFESHWDERRAGTRQLHVGQDFDLVVLGTSIGALPHVASELLARDTRWQKMVKEVKTVATQAFQLWMNTDVRALGWRESRVLLAGFVEPFDTWADMSHLAPEESWRQPPQSIAYFCNVLPEPPPTPHSPDQGFLAAEHHRVRTNAIHFLNHDIGWLWPLAVRREGFRWELLLDPSEGTPERTGEARFDSQFFTANVNPSDRYVLSLPGASRHRISPLDLTFDNLTIAGDWTESGLNSGCVESAVMSGQLAAHAISGWPPLETIIGYDHP